MMWINGKQKPNARPNAIRRELVPQDEPISLRPTQQHQPELFN